jgi:hypothetical protein
LATCPSRALSTIASINAGAWITSSGRRDQSFISSITFSVIREIVSSLTETP